MKRHGYQKLTGTLALVLGISFAMPANLTGATCKWDGWGDFNSDGIYDVQDEKILLDKILQSDDLELEGMGYYDYNEDGEITVEDLYIMNQDMYTEDQPIQGEAPLHKDITPVVLEQVVSGDAVLINVKLKDSLAETGYFDYAVLYDKEKLKVEDIQWSEAWRAQFPEEQNAYVKADKEDYVLLGGTYFHPQEITGVEAADENTMATIIFSYKNDQKETGVIDLVSHATRYDKKVQNLRLHADNALQLGDVDRDGDVNLEDVKQVLHKVLFKKNVNMHECYMADFNNNGKLELSDAASILKMAMKVDQPSVISMNWNPMRGPIYAEWITETAINKDIDLRLLQNDMANDGFYSYMDSFSSLQVRDVLQGFHNVCQWKAALASEALLEGPVTSRPLTIPIGTGPNSLGTAKLVAQIPVHTDNVEDISYQFESEMNDVYMHVKEPAYATDSEIYYLHVICCVDVFGYSQDFESNRFKFHVEIQEKIPDMTER